MTSLRRSAAAAVALAAALVSCGAPSYATPVMGAAPSSAPTVIAHAAHLTPGGEENTTAQINRLGAAGVRIVEVDVRYSSTGWPVLMHDATVDRTTTGHGYVGRMTVGALAKLKPKVPTLRAALAAARAHNMGMLLDLKTNGATKTQVANTTAEIRRSGWAGQVTMISDARVASRRAALHAYHAKGHRTGWVEPYPGRARTPAEITAGTGDKHPYWLVGQDTPHAVLDQLNAAGVQVTVGTPNNPSGWANVQGHGVDTVFSDRPTAYISWLAGTLVNLYHRYPDGDLS